MQPKLVELIEKFEDVFVVHKELPPNRPHDHIILLVDGATLVNTRPYMHPPTQNMLLRI